LAFNLESFEINYRFLLLSQIVYYYDFGVKSGPKKQISCWSIKKRRYGYEKEIKWA